ncbi:MAG: CBS domain-containing protein, partial [Spirochaetota bacterium]|nr:CBS domain-containing protein [Spirochaetota bacterium]
DSLEKAAQLMAENHVGAVVAMRQAGVMGIFTERDLMRAIGEKKDPAGVTIGKVVTNNYVKVRSDAKCSDCLMMMKENKCRHLLVFDDDSFVGIIALSDLAQLLLQQKEDLIKQLEQYITS